LRLPRDVSGDELAQRLSRLGYQVTRQTGSHMRLTRRAEVEHHITIPRHKALRVSTLSNILRDVADHLKIDRQEVIQRLWGKDVP
jgi:predicted RNA binding protein YcfA (HicA-like mRNA interferase family)